MAKSKLTKDQALAVLAKRGLDTKEGALAAYADLVVARWGESEREAARRQKARDSHGLIVNSVVHFDVDAIDEELAAAAKHLLTDDDWHELRKGG